MKKVSDEVTKEKAMVADTPLHGAKVQWLFSKKDGTKHATMRKFTMKSTVTSVHIHPWEHIIYVLNGEGSIYVDNKWFDAKKDDVFFIPENVCHSYSCEKSFVFLCVIPNEGDKR